MCLLLTPPPPCVVTPTCSQRGGSPRTTVITTLSSPCGPLALPGKSNLCWPENWPCPLPLCLQHISPGPDGSPLQSPQSCSVSRPPSLPAWRPRPGVALTSAPPYLPLSCAQSYMPFCSELEACAVPGQTVSFPPPRWHSLCLAPRVAVRPWGCLCHHPPLPPPTTQGGPKIDMSSYWDIKHHCAHMCFLKGSL